MVPEQLEIKVNRVLKKISRTIIYLFGHPVSLMHVHCNLKTSLRGTLHNILMRKCLYWTKVRFKARPIHLKTIVLTLNQLIVLDNDITTTLLSARNWIFRIWEGIVDLETSETMVNVNEWDYHRSLKVSR